MTETAERIEQAGPIRRGVVVWFAVFGGVVAWTQHLLALAASTRFTCTRPGSKWGMHVDTLACAVVTAAAIVLAYRLYRAGDPRAEADDSAAGRLAFLGVVGLAIGGISLALIIVEGVYAGVLRSCG
jgi:hypothetical protein